MTIGNKIFQDADAAREYLESTNWPEGPVCPHCGVINRAYKLEGETHRKGLYKCKDCRKQFSVTVGTVFDRSHVPLNKWLLCVHLLSSSKKGMSSHQIHRTIGVTYKTAWFMTHRIREAMKDPIFTSQIGGGGKVVEADETYVGAKGNPKKEKVFSLVERGGKVRSLHVPAVNSRMLKPVMQQLVAEDTKLFTDDAGWYKSIGKEFQAHESVCHSRDEYVRGEIHTNTIENYFSILKRGLSGIYQHVSERHLRRYVGEFDFRYNNRHITDGERAAVALRGIAGKRLRYTKSLL